VEAFLDLAELCSIRCRVALAFLILEVLVMRDVGEYVCISLLSALDEVVGLGEACSSVST